MNFDDLLVGHQTIKNGCSGVTVFLPERRVSCGWWLCGSAPATRDVSLLDPGIHMDQIDALLFSGGSAYGLGASNGVMQWLQEQGRGYPTKQGVVPIVPAAAIYDLSDKGIVFRTAEDAYQACKQASKNNQLQGAVGAGTAATVGKWLDTPSFDRGGFGQAQITCPTGLKVLACVVVNSVGSVLDEQGRVVAGVRDASGNLVNVAESLLSGQMGKTAVGQQNTTLLAIFTNAVLNKAQLTRVSKMASAGMARAIAPAFTCYDGDAVFSISLGTQIADEVVIGALAAQATHTAILNAVK